MKSNLFIFFLISIPVVLCFSSTDPFAPMKSDLIDSRSCLETWTLTVNPNLSYPPSVPASGFDPLDYHDDNYSREEFNMVRFIQNNGIDFLGVPRSKISLSKYAIDAISVLKEYKYDIVITSTPENVEEIFKLISRYHQVERKRLNGVE